MADHNFELDLDRGGFDFTAFGGVPGALLPGHPRAQPRPESPGDAGRRPEMQPPEKQPRAAAATSASGPAQSRNPLGSATPFGRTKVDLGWTPTEDDMAPWPGWRSAAFGGASVKGATGPAAGATPPSSVWTSRGLRNAAALGGHTLPGMPSVAEPLSGPLLSRDPVSRVPARPMPPGPTGRLSAGPAVLVASAAASAAGAGPAAEPGGKADTGSTGDAAETGAAPRRAAGGANLATKMADAVHTAKQAGGPAALDLEGVSPFQAAVSPFGSSRDERRHGGSAAAARAAASRASSPFVKHGNDAHPTKVNHQAYLRAPLTDHMHTVTAKGRKTGAALNH